MIMESQDHYFRLTRRKSGAVWCDDTLLTYTSIRSWMIPDFTSTLFRVGLEHMFLYMFYVCSHTCISYLVRILSVPAAFLVLLCCHYLTA
jgi:hypothetical protein